MAATSRPKSLHRPIAHHGFSSSPPFPPSTSLESASCDNHALRAQNKCLSRLIRAGRLHEAQRMFDGLDRWNTVTWNTMFAAHIRNRDVSPARRLFDGMPERDPMSWNTLLSGYAGFAGYFEEARILFDRMPERDAVSWNTMIAASMPRRNAVSWNTLMTGFLENGEVEKAVELAQTFNETPQKDCVSWNTMITGLVNASEMDEAGTLFQRMPEPNSWTWTLMVSGFAQKGELEKARCIFDRMPRKTLVSWNSMIVGHEQNGDHEGGIKLFSRMRDSGEKPDWHTFYSMLGACAGLAVLRLGMQIHQLIVKTLIADIPINNSLITMYSRCGNISDAKAVFDGMTTRKDAVTWNAMIGMKRVRVRPTHACGHAGLVNEGRKQFDSMVSEFGITPHVEHYASLVDIMGRYGRLEDALDVIRNMQVSPGWAVWGALLGAARAHDDAGFAKVAAEALMEIEPENAVPYVMLFNVCVDAKSWEDAGRVRDEMGRRGIKKQRGQSWIEMRERGIGVPG
ncbi:Pentatricopeptide repeat-containing protein [Acorus calamus]|uniref:Pentatricopeptide repeat-containing protein n=1 Tax=Acorus calamus TaxID=4465 RepID=A0AAV9E8E2_ACOCL|nr:Pentatricopeptide repeat-containing protein [Acorus calamus]